MPVGTTSACAENKLLRIFPPPPGRNYLRVRGEYKPPAEDRAWHPELPPRARRIHHRTQPYYVGLGTTSACAENTTNSRERQKAARNYLRVRGEYMGDAYQLAQALELPPRARRIRFRGFFRVFVEGTTSACAENTFNCRRCSSSLRNYLRVRGEYSRSSSMRFSNMEAYSAAGKTWFGWWLVEHYLSYHVNCPDGCGLGEPTRGR